MQQSGLVRGCCVLVQFSDVIVFIIKAFHIQYYVFQKLSCYVLIANSILFFASVYTVLLF